MKRFRVLLIICLLGAGTMFSQSINLKMGFFIPALQSDMWEEHLQNLEFNKSDMISSYLGAEFETSLNRYTSLSIEFGSFNKTVETQYKYYFYPDNSPILRYVALRITSMEANIKFYPFGSSKLISPYLGAGAGLYAWTFQQWGDFVIFPDTFIRYKYAHTRTFSFGFNGRAGLVFRFHPLVALAMEGKYQYLRGQLSRYFEGYELLDLGGITATFGINIYLK